MEYTSTVRTTLRMAGAGTALLAGALLLPQSAVAQACIGNPAMTGQFALGGMLSTSDGSTGYGVEARTNPGGPLALGASISTIDVDGASDNVFQATANGAWDLGSSAFSACPAIGVEYTQYPDDFFGFEASSIGVPVGFAAGIQAGSGSIQFLPSAEAGLLWQRFSTSGTAGGVTFSETDTETDLYFRGGATAVTGRFYGRAQLERIFHDDAENLFRFSVGLLF